MNRFFFCMIILFVIWKLCGIKDNCTYNIFGFFLGLVIFIFNYYDKENNVFICCLNGIDNRGMDN